MLTDRWLDRWTPLHDPGGHPEFQVCRWSTGRSAKRRREDRENGPGRSQNAAAIPGLRAKPLVLRDLGEDTTRARSDAAGSNISPRPIPILAGGHDVRAAADGTLLYHAGDPADRPFDRLRAAGPGTPHILDVPSHLLRCPADQVSPWLSSFGPAYF